MKNNEGDYIVIAYIAIAIILCAVISIFTPIGANPITELR
tara:strand:+ start:180 stop:299 length:120 start_codon:yes stop_codon:yes gene_type:complete